MSVPHSTMPTSDSADGQRDQQPVRAVDRARSADQTAMRRKPIVPEDGARARGPARSRAASPATSRRSLTSPSASARMMSVAACEPELPPLEMISGTNSARTTALRDLLLEEAHRRRREHLAEEQRRQPAGALPDHAPEARSACRARRAPRMPPNRWMSSVAASSATSSTSSTVTMPMSMPAVSVTGSADAVYRAEDRDRRLLVVGRLQRDEAAVHQVRDACGRGGVSRISRMRMSSISTPCSSTT